MTEAARPSVEGGAVLRFAPHAKFRFDEVRQAWIVLAPERLLLPDEQAVEILQLIDGERAVDGVIDELARRYEAPREVIAGDVVKMLQDLVDKKVLRR
jgi:pyrroloquinoline quinone biosynthesis protein D